MVNYYKITTKLGHQGTGKYKEITFYIKAKDINKAINKALHMPGVKHNNPSSILSASIISEENYKNNITTSAYEKFKKN